LRGGPTCEGAPLPSDPAWEGDPTIHMTRLGMPVCVVHASSSRDKPTGGRDKPTGLCVCGARKQQQGQTHRRQRLAQGGRTRGTSRGTSRGALPWLNLCFLFLDVATPCAWSVQMATLSFGATQCHMHPPVHAPTCSCTHMFMHRPILDRPVHAPTCSCTDLFLHRQFMHRPVNAPACSCTDLFLHAPRPLTERSAAGITVLEQLIAD